MQFNYSSIWSIFFYCGKIKRHNCIGCSKSGQHRCHDDCVVSYARDEHCTWNPRLPGLRRRLVKNGWRTFKSNAHHPDPHVYSYLRFPQFQWADTIVPRTRLSSILCSSFVHHLPTARTVYVFAVWRKPTFHERSWRNDLSNYLFVFWTSFPRSD